MEVKFGTVHLKVLILIAKLTQFLFPFLFYDRACWWPVGRR